MTMPEGSRPVTTPSDRRPWWRRISFTKQILVGLTLGVFDTIVAADVSSTWRDAIVYGLIIAVLLIRAFWASARRWRPRG